MSDSQATIITPGKIITENPTTEKYRTRLKLDPVYISERIAKGLRFDPYDVGDHSNIPPELQPIPVAIPLPGSRTYESCDRIISDMIASRLYTFIDFDDITTSPTDPDAVSGRKFLILNARNVNGKVAVANCYIMLAHKDHLNMARDAQRLRNRGAFGAMLEKKGEAYEKLAEKGELEPGIDVITHEDSYKKMSGSISFDDLVGLYNQVGKGDVLEEALGVTPGKPNKLG